MATEAASLFVSLTANTAGFTKSLDQAEKRVKSFSGTTNSQTKTIADNYNKQGNAVKSFGNTASDAHGKVAKAAEDSSGRQVKANKAAGSSISGLVGGLVALGGAYAAYGAAKNAIQTTMDLTGATIRLSAVTGMDAKTTSTWIEVFKARNISVTQAQMGFITLEKAVTGAASGSKTAVAAFDRLGVSMDVLKSGDTQRIILATADGFAKLTNPVERAALAQQLFGRNAKALIPLLSGGSAAIAAALTQAQKYGAYIGGDVAKDLMKMRAAQIEFNYALEGLKITFAVAVLPYLAKAMVAFNGFVVGMREGTGAGGAFKNAIVTAFGVVKGSIQGVIGIFGSLSNAIKGLAAVFIAVKLVSLVSAVASGFAALAAVGIAGGPLMVGIAALATAAYLVMTNWGPVKKFFEDLLGTAQGIKPPAVAGSIPQGPQPNYQPGNMEAPSLTPTLNTAQKIGAEIHTIIGDITTAWGAMTAWISIILDECLQPTLDRYGIQQRKECHCPDHSVT